MRIFASIAILASAVDSRIRALDVLDPWGDWPTWIATSPFVPEDERTDYMKPEFLKKAATLEPVSGRGIQAGDVVTMDYVGTIDGEPFEGGTADDIAVVIGSKSFIPGFEEQLLGMGRGETRTVTATLNFSFFAAKLRPSSPA